MLTNEVISKYITTMLGGSAVKVELDKEDLEVVIDQAMDKMRAYYYGIRYIQVKGIGPIDLSSHNIIDIVQLYETGSQGITQLQSQMFLNPGVFVFNSDYKDNYIAYLTYAKLASMYQSTNNMTWKYDSVRGICLLSKNAECVLKCRVKVMSLSDIEEDSRWYSWVKEYSLALSKQLVGRKRSKYTLSNAQYQLDGNQLIAEGMQEQARLEDGMAGSFPVY